MKINFIISIPFQRSIRDQELTRVEYKYFNLAKLELEKFWNENGDKIQKELKNITKLNFKRSEIDCFLNTEFSVSSPLCLIVTDFNLMKSFLIHELIHCLFTDNVGNHWFDKRWSFYFETLNDEKMLVKSHVYLHAIHIKLCSNLFPNFECWYDSKHQDYVRSFDIVKFNGVETILSSFLNMKKIGTPIKYTSKET